LHTYVGSIVIILINCTKSATLCRDQIRQKEERIVHANNFGLFYKHINSRLQHRCPIGAFINHSGDVITSDEVKANIFNEYFATTGVVDDGKIPVCHPTVLKRTLETVIFTETDNLGLITVKM